jgi:hypothetical protein
MRTIKKRLLAAALATFMLLPLASCAAGDEGKTPADSTAEEGTASQEDLLYENLPTGNFGGYEFNILQYKETTAATSTVLTERTGNPIEDKIYERALAVEDRLKVEFVNHLDTMDAVSTTLRNSIAGGLDDYDVCWNHSSQTVANFLAAGYLIDMNTVDGLDFEKPWWDDTANDYLALDNHIYMAFGDINVYLYDFHSAMLFNKEITTDHKLNMYSMVDNGTWTMEQFIRLATELALPAADGSGSYDRMGYAGYAYATMYGFIHGAGVELFTYDENGLPSLGAVSETYQNVLSKYSELFKDTKLCNTWDGETVSTFAAQEATFISCGVGQLGALREEAFDYGLLPFPKYNQEQKNYISFVSNQIQPMVIPKSASDPDRTGVILENLAAESYRRVRPEYFQVLLESKYVRDRESMEIMEMIFNSETHFELEQIYNWNNLNETVVKALIGEGDSFASATKRLSRAVNNSIEKTMAYLEQGNS